MPLELAGPHGHDGFRAENQRMPFVVQQGHGDKALAGSHPHSQHSAALAPGKRKGGTLVPPRFCLQAGKGVRYRHIVLRAGNIVRASQGKERIPAVSLRRARPECIQYPAGKLFVFRPQPALPLRTPTPPQGLAYLRQVKGNPQTDMGVRHADGNGLVHGNLLL